MSDVVISIDPSLRSTGVVVFVDGKPHKYESITPYPVYGLQRLAYNYAGFCRILSIYPHIKCVAFERQIPQMRYNKNASSILSLSENIGLLKLAITQTALKNNPELIILHIPPEDIKYYATGNKKADKDMMISSVNGHHMRAIRSMIPEWSVNDIADAYHLGRLAISLLEDDSYIKYNYNTCDEVLKSHV